MTYEDLNLLKTFKALTGVTTTFTYDATGAFISESKDNGLFQQISENNSIGTKVLLVIANWGVSLKQILSSTSSLETTQHLNNHGQTIRTEVRGSSFTNFYENNDTYATGLTEHPLWGADNMLPAYQSNYLSFSVDEASQNIDSYSYSYGINVNDSSFPTAALLTKRTTHDRITAGVDKSTFSDTDGVKKITSTTVTELTPAITFLNNQLQPTRIEPPRRTPIDFIYNEEGQLARYEKGADFESYTYDNFGFLKSTTNSKNQTTSYLNDAQGKVLTKTLPNGDQIKFEYTAAGSIKKITTPSNQVHNFEFDLGDYIKEYFSPGNSAQYFYDSDKRLTQIKKPSQKTIIYNRDASTGALTSISTSEGNYVFSEQDPQYRPHLLTSPDGIQIKASYLGNMTKIQEWYDSDGTLIAKLNFKFDGPRTRIRSIELNDAVIENINYDTYGQITNINNTSYTFDPDKISTYTGSMAVKTLNVENSEGNNMLLTNATLNGGPQQLYITMSRIFDNFGQATDYTLTTQNSEGGVFNNYTFQTPTYDTNNRLIQAQRNRKTYINSILTTSTDFQNNYYYPPNSNNNMTEFSQIIGNASIPSRRTIATFAPDDKLLALNGNINRTYSYTEDGEIQTMTNCFGITTYEYDLFSNLKKVTMSDEKIIEYKTDALNRRVKKLINNSAVEYYVWYDQTHLAAILDANKVVKIIYIYGPESNSPTLMLKDGVSYKILADPGLGSIRFVVNPVTAQIVQEIEYDEFGNIMNNTNPTFQPVLYAGGLYDFDTKLYRFGARDYDPTIGRWTTKDPIGFAGGDTNLYAYVGGNPMSYTDPTGHCPSCLIGAIIGAAANVYEASQANLSTRQIVASGVLGAATGALAGSGIGLIQSALLSGASGFFNNAGNQIISNGQAPLNFNRAALAGAYSLAGGALGAGTTNLSNRIFVSSISEGAGFVSGNSLSFLINSGITTGANNQCIGN